MDLIREIENEQLKQDIPDFGPGDTVRAHMKVVEGGKERIQVYEGVCLSRGKHGLRETATIRKISHGIGVERTLMLNSPRIAKIEVTRRGEVRQARLFYLRDRIGKKARVKEKRFAPK